MKYYFFFLVLLPVIAEAQLPAAVIQKAMACNGNWEMISTLQYRTDRTNYNPLQSYAYGHPTAQQDRYEIALDLKNGRLWHHTLNHYPGGYLFNTTRIARDSVYYVYDVTGARTGKSLLKLGYPFYINNYRKALSNFPYYILKEVSDSQDSLQSALAGKEIIIRRTLKAGTQELWLDAQTGQLHKNVRISGQDTISQYFDAYTTIKGCQVPQKVRQLFNNKLVFKDQLTMFAISTTAEIFDLPPGYHPEEVITKPLIAKEITKDVFLVEKIDDDRNIIFINMDDYIVLTEAPVSKEITAAIIALIHKTLPGKPIRYVHLSHFHEDHIAGIRMLVEEGASIICTSVMEKPVRELLSGVNPSFTFFNGRKTISDSKHRIDFIEMPNSHAQGLSFLYLPAEAFIFEGDLLALPEDGTITPAIQVSKEFYLYLKKNKLAYKRIIAHHGLSDITPEIFDKMNNKK